MVQVVSGSQNASQMHPLTGAAAQLPRLVGEGQDHET